MATSRRVPSACRWRPTPRLASLRPALEHRTRDPPDLVEEGVALLVLRQDPPHHRVQGQLAPVHAVERQGLARYVDQRRHLGDRIGRAEVRAEAGANRLEEQAEQLAPVVGHRRQPALGLVEDQADLGPWTGEVQSHAHGVVKPIGHRERL